MNIILEGISGCGKTTLINKLCKELKKRSINFEKIEDLGYDTPLKSVLLKMVSINPLMKEEYLFKTSIYESLLLAANHHFVQEKLRDSDKICIYDRDFISLLSYQKEIMKSEYENWEELFEIYKKLVLFELKKVDYIVYLQVPFKESIKRTEERDKRKFSKEDITMLKNIKRNIEIEIKNFDNGNNIIYLDGTENIQKNLMKILEKISEE